METVNVAIVKFIETYNEDGYERLIAASITDWQTISRDDYHTMLGHLPKGYKVVYRPSPEEEQKIIIRSVAEGIKEAEVYRQAEEKRKADLAARKKLREQNKLKKALADKQKLYEQLRVELGEVPDVLK